MRIALAALAIVMMTAGGAVSAYAQFEFDQCSNTTAWVPAEIELPGQGLHTVTMGDDLYIIHRTASPDTTVLALSKWDGSVLTPLSTFICKRPIAHAAAYQGSIYISGIFTSVNDIAGTSGLARWDGTGWSAVAGNPFYIRPGQGWRMQWEQIFAMTVYRDELLVSGSFLRSNNIESAGIFGWNGTSWRKIVEASDINDSLQVTAFAEWRGDLYVGGYFSRIGGVEAHGVARWDGTTWSIPGDGTENLRRVLELIVYQDRLYAIGNLNNAVISRPEQSRDSLDLMARWDGTAWERIADVIPKQSDDLIIHVRAAVYNGELYIMAQSFRNGPLGRRFDGSRGEAIAQPNDKANFMIEYRGGLYMGGKFTGSCGMGLGHFAQLCTPLDCFGISGQVRNDPSGDCTDSLAAGGLPGRIVRLVPGDRYAVTDSNGYYRIYAPVGEYSLGLLPVRHWNQLCPPAGTGWDVAVSTPSGSVRKNFVTAAIPGRHDLAVSVAGGRLRRFMNTDYTIRCTNLGTTVIPATTVRFEFDSRLGRPSPAPAASRAGNGWMEWDLTGVPPAGSHIFRIAFGVPGNISVGTMICASAAAELTGDVVPDDNRDTVCTVVIDSYDPNDMAVSPAGPGNNGHISVTDSLLTYTVRFQNTGTDTAFRVVVVDTLTSTLDLTSLRLGAASHPFTLKIRDGGALIFIFDDIDLPHKKINDEGSQGYFRFSIGMNGRPRPNTRISNRAQIYFDYNDPITTNTVVSTVVETPVSSVESGSLGDASDTGVRVFPNPAHGAVYLRGPIVQGSVVEVRNMLGDLVLASRYERPGDAEIDLEGLPAGKYLLNVQTPAGREAHTITLVR